MQNRVKQFYKKLINGNFKNCSEKKEITNTVAIEKGVTIIENNE